MTRFVAPNMRSLKEIVRLKQKTGIAMGLVAALAILLTQSFYYDHVARVNDKIKTEVADQAEDDTEVLTMAQDAVSTVAHVMLVQTLHFIAEIYLDNGEDIKGAIINDVRLSSYFRALFNLIISPNAP